MRRKEKSLRSILPSREVVAVSRAVKTFWTMVRTDNSTSSLSLSASAGYDTFFAILTTALIRSSHRVSSNDIAILLADERFGNLATDRDLWVDLLCVWHNQMPTSEYFDVDSNRP